MNVVVYTDASLVPFNQIAACGYLVLNSGGYSIKHEIVIMDNIKSSYIAECKAISFAIEYCFLLENIQNITIYTEMDYVVDGRFSKKTKKDRYPYNEELTHLVEILTEHSVFVEFKKVKAHSGNFYNNKIDNSVGKALRNYVNENRKKAITCNA